MLPDTDICELCQRENPGLQWTIGGVIITIGALCSVVQRLKPGSSRFTWAAVSRALGISKAATSASTMLKRRYEQYIQPYELTAEALSTEAAAEDEVAAYLAQRAMFRQLSDKFTEIPRPRFTDRAQEILQFQAFRTGQFQAANKPKAKVDQLPGNLHSEGHSLTLYGEPQPLTDDFLVRILQKIDGVTSLTLGPLHHVTAVPPFNLLYQSLEELIIYDLPAHIVEDVYDMALEQLPKLHTLHLINTTSRMCAVPRPQAPASLRGVNVEADMSIW